MATWSVEVKRSDGSSYKRQTQADSDYVAREKVREEESRKYPNQSITIGKATRI